MQKKPTKASLPYVEPFTVVVDDREGAPWFFKGFVTDAKDHRRIITVPREVARLETGDYSILGCESKIALERKSLADLYGTLSTEERRTRFAKEHERMRQIIQCGGLAAVLIESSQYRALTEPPEPSRLNPKTIKRTMESWLVEYGVPWLWCDSRSLAESNCLRILEKFWHKRISPSWA